jgi:peroxiredoxin
MEGDLGVASLQDLLDEVAAGLAIRSPGTSASLRTELQKLADSGIARQALRVGAKAPDFALVDAGGRTVSLSALLAKGPAVVTFYRGNWCPFCDLQLRSYQGVLPQVRRLGAELVAISPQTADYALLDVEKKQLAFPVLSDGHNRVARQYGLVFTVSDALKELMGGFGHSLPRFNGDDSWELPIPATFVVDQGGMVRLAHVEPDYMRRLEPASVLLALQGLRS